MYKKYKPSFYPIGIFEEKTISQILLSFETWKVEGTQKMVHKGKCCENYQVWEE